MITRATPRIKGQPEGFLGLRFQITELSLVFTANYLSDPTSIGKLLTRPSLISCHVAGTGLSNFIFYFIFLDNKKRDNINNKC